jgi:hypothetical protein
MGMMLAGTLFMFLMFGPPVGIGTDWIPYPWFIYVGYFYPLGIILLIGVIVVRGMTRLRTDGGASVTKAINDSLSELDAAATDIGHALTNGPEVMRK